jgi:hypothetical protein
VAKDDAPLAMLEPVALASSEGSLLDFAGELATHVLQINGYCQVSGDNRQKVLDVESSKVQVLRGPREMLAHLVPPLLVCPAAPTSTTSSSRDQSA